jgi:phosphatidylglycerol---prolipoprotein diacylglyceryl transferase
MIPCVDVDTIPIGSLVLQPFGFMMSLSIAFGWWMMSRRARTLRLDEHEFLMLRLWSLSLGLFLSHALDEVFYHPELLADHPVSLLYIWQGLSSMGGIVGAVLGALLWSRVRISPRGVPSFRARPAALLPVADVIAPCFVVAWTLGRFGCAIVHDHVSARVPVGTPLAVAFPAPGELPAFVSGPLRVTFGSAPRYDLGLLELFFTLMLAAAILATWRRRLAVGTYVVVTSLAYAPVRFALDRLRERDGMVSDLRWGALTFAQWSCFALFAFGVAVAISIRATGEASRPPDRPAAAS